jgi:hypothetical protein
MAMSPRLLRPRATGFNPKSIASLSVWLDASDASTLVLNGGNVSEWQSKVGSVVFSQGTAASQPALLLAQLNAKNVVSFDGVSGVLESSSPAVSGTPCTLVFVAKWRLASDGIAAVFGQSGSQLVLYNGTPNTFRLFNGANLSTEESAPVDGWLVVAAVANETQSKIFFNNALKVTGNSGAFAVDGAAYLGAWLDGSDFTEVDVAEALTFNSELTSRELSDLHAYLFSKWGIVV